MKQIQKSQERRTRQGEKLKSALAQREPLGRLAGAAHGPQCQGPRARQLGTPGGGLALVGETQRERDALESEDGPGPTGASHARQHPSPDSHCPPHLHMGKLRPRPLGPCPRVPTGKPCSWRVCRGTEQGGRVRVGRTGISGERVSFPHRHLIHTSCEPIFENRRLRHTEVRGQA